VEQSGTRVAFESQQEGDVVVASRLGRMLEENKAHYTTIKHAVAFTSRDLAAALHTDKDEIAKATIVRASGGYAMAVLPASHQLDLKHMARALGVPWVSLASESELASLFPGCELGAIPPFGHLYGMPVYVDVPLTNDKWIAFCSGRHDEAIRMLYADYERIVKPAIRELHAEPARYHGYSERHVHG
jgi:Ala-tRNA(Pro) deacylase